MACASTPERETCQPLGKNIAEALTQDTKAHQTLGTRKHSHNRNTYIPAAALNAAETEAQQTLGKIRRSHKRGT